MMNSSLPHLIHAGRFASSRDVPEHTHIGAELVLVVSGRCRCDVGGRMLEGRPGTLWVMPPRVPQVQYTLTFSRTSYLVFDTPPDQFDTQARSVQLDRTGLIWKWIEDLCQMHGGSPDPAAEVADALLLAVLRGVVRAEAASAAQDAIHPGLGAALAILENRLAEPILAGDLAREAGLSPSHLNALFHEQFGCGPIARQGQMRMELARRLLGGPYLSVKEVALACGYRDANYFVRVFRAHFGISPGAWRMNA